MGILYFVGFLIPNQRFSKIDLGGEEERDIDVREKH